MGAAAAGGGCAGGGEGEVRSFGEEIIDGLKLLLFTARMYICFCQIM